MGWEKKTERPCRHPNRPKLPEYYGNSHMIGDIWRCDCCNARFQVDKGTELGGGQIYQDTWTIEVLKWNDITHWKQKNVYINGQWKTVDGPEFNDF